LSKFDFEYFSITGSLPHSKLTMPSFRNCRHPGCTMEPILGEKKYCKGLQSKIQPCKVKLFVSNLMFPVCFTYLNFRFYCVSRLFSLVWGFCDIYMWKGVWDGLDCIFGMNYVSAIVPFVIGTMILVFTKSFRSALSLPVGIVIDDKKANCCEAQTFWDLKVNIIQTDE